MAQAFDFNALLSNPAFQFGTSMLLGARNPNVANQAFNTVNNTGQLNQQREYQTGMLAHQERSDAVAQEQYARQNDFTRAQIDLMKRRMDRQDEFMKRFRQMQGAGLFGPTQTPAAPPSMPDATGAQGQSLEYGVHPPGITPGQPMPPSSPIQDVAPFNPDDPRDPAGPFNGGGRQGQFGPPPPGQLRPMLKTNAITPQLLNGLERTESGGNPNAIGPPIPGKPYRAQGAFQFIPPTVDMLAKQGIKFDPFNREQSREAAGGYLGSLTQKFGGSLDRAIAAYKGFSNVDSPAAKAAVRKVYTAAGMPMPQQQQQQMQQQQQAPQQQPQGQDAPGAPINVDGGMSNPGMQMAAMAMDAGMSEMPGADEMMKYAQMMAPQTVTPNTYRVSPVDGKMQYIGDPMGIAHLGLAQQHQKNDNTRLGLDVNHAQNENTRVGFEGNADQRAAAKQQYEMGGGQPGQLPQKAIDSINSSRFEVANAEINKSLDAHKELPNQLGALRRAQADVNAMLDPKTRSKMTPIGMASSSKLLLLKTFSNTFGYDAPKDVANAEDFNSAMSQLWMKAVKQVDSNSTGSQQKSIQASFGTLANDPGALKRILAETETSFVRQMRLHNKSVAQYQSKMGADPYDRFLDTGMATPAGTKVGGKEHGYFYLGGDVADPNSWTK